MSACNDIIELINGNMAVLPWQEDQLSLQMIYGRSGSGKTSFMFEKLRKSLEKDPDIRKKRYVIVPDQFSYMMERKILETFGEKYVFSIQVCGFKMLSQRVLERTGGIKKSVLSPVGRSMLLSKIAGEKKEELKVYRKTATYAGFAQLISDTVKEFKDYSITPKELLEASEKLEMPDLKEKLIDLHTIYKEYEARIESGYIDTEDQMSIAAEKINNAAFLKGAEFYIDEFSDFTPIQLKTIKEFIRTGDTYITLTLDEGIGNEHTGVFSLTRDTDNELMDIIRETGVRLEKPVFLKGSQRFKENPELGFIESEFYSYPNKEWEEEPEAVRIRRCSDLYEEIEFVAKDILQKVRNEGLRYKDFAVLLRNIESYKSILKSVMDEYEIPIFIDSRKEIDSNPLATFIASFFEIKKQNFTFDPTFKYLKTYLTSVDMEHIDILENYCLANGIESWKWNDDFWKYKVQDVTDELEAARLLNLVNEIKDEIYNVLNESFSKIEEEKTVKGKATVFYDFLVKSGALKTYSGWIKDFENNDKEKHLEYSGVLNALMSVLDQMVESMGNEDINTEDFGNTILVGLSTSKISIIPATLDQVIAGDISRVRSSTVRGIYVVGVNDGVLPRNPESTGIFTDADRETLREIQFKISRDSKARAFYEQFYVYNALTIADKFLTVTYPIADHEGKSLRPSTVPGRLKRLFPKLIEEAPEDLGGGRDKGVTELSGKNEAFRELLGQIRRHHDMKPVDQKWREVYSYFKNSEYSRKLASCEEGIRFTNYPAVLKAESVDKLYGRNLNLTVSRLERYNSCPFSYFAEFGLKAKERKEFILNTPDVGILMHDVLDKFTRRISEERLDWKDVSKDYTERTVDELMEKVIEEGNNSVISSTSRNKYLGTKVKRIISSSVGVIKNQIVRGEFTPMFSEVAFGKDSQFKPLILNLEGDRKVNISGRIDRIDVFRDTNKNYIRIIDYKSFGKTLTLKDIYYGLQLQLLVYLNVVLENSDRILRGDTFPGAVLYMRLDKPVVESFSGMTDNDLEVEILKSLKLKGLILKDAKIVRSMDKDMEGVSLVIPAKIKKDGDVTGTGTENNDLLVSEEQFDVLREYVSHIVVETCMSLLSGNISITPVLNDGKPQCLWCPYKSLCQFDRSLKGFDYKKIKKMKGEEAFKLISEKERGGVNDGMDQ